MTEFLIFRASVVPVIVETAVPVALTEDKKP